MNTSLAICSDRSPPPIGGSTPASSLVAGVVGAIEGEAGPGRVTSLGGGGWPGRGGGGW